MKILKPVINIVSVGLFNSLMGHKYKVYLTYMKNSVKGKDISYLREITKNQLFYCESDLRKHIENLKYAMGEMAPSILNKTEIKLN
jgi:hypothetical protein